MKFMLVSMMFSLGLTSTSAYAGRGPEYQNEAPKNEAQRLVKSEYSSKVYLVKGKQKLHIPNGKIFVASNFKWDEIEVIGANELSSYSVAYYIKKSGNNNFYYLNPTTKQKTLRDNQYIRYTNALELPEAFFDYYPTAKKTNQKYNSLYDAQQKTNLTGYTKIYIPNYYFSLYSKNNKVYILNTNGLSLLPKAEASSFKIENNNINIFTDAKYAYVTDYTNNTLKQVAGFKKSNKTKLFDTVYQSGNTLYNFDKEGKVRIYPIATGKKLTEVKNAQNFYTDGETLYSYSNSTGVLSEHKGVSPKNFEIVWQYQNQGYESKYLAKNDNGYYYGEGMRKLNIDTTSFEIIEHYKAPSYNKNYKQEYLVAKDKNALYFGAKDFEKVSFIDPASVEIIAKNYYAYAKDKKGVYFYNPTYGTIQKIEGANPKTFTLEKNQNNNSFILKDDNQFWIIQGYNYEITEIDGVNPKTAKIVTTGYLSYVVDGSKIYTLNSEGKTQYHKGIDGKTFKEMKKGEGFLFQDKNNIYILDREWNGERYEISFIEFGSSANGSSEILNFNYDFAIMKNDNGLFLLDENNDYRYGRDNDGITPVKQTELNLDPESFEIVYTYRYEATIMRDTNTIAVYSDEGLQYKEVDGASFEIIKDTYNNIYYAKDNNHVYYLNPSFEIQTVVGADPKTFEVYRTEDGKYMAEDKNHKWEYSPYTGKLIRK